MLIKRLIFKKILSSGMVAEFLLVNNDGEFQAALHVGGKYIPGPSKPQALSEPKGEITHWMGNRPSVGLSQEEVDKILKEIEIETEIVNHRIRSGWGE